MDEVKPDRQLKGKTNFISWKREFERAARANDVLEFLTGEEVVPPKPNKDEYFLKVLDAETRRSTRIKKSLSPTTDDENETDDGQAVVLTTNNTLRWQIDYNDHKAAKDKMKLATKLLDTWITDGIKIEVEDCADAKEAYDFIKKRYAVTNERARDILLNRLNDLKLDNCLSVTDYTNQVRQIKADLKTVKYDMTDDMFATALLHGLPPSYRGFKEKYDWIRSMRPEDSPDLDYLFERMHVEEMHQLQIKEERKTRDKAKRDATSINSTMNMDNTRYRPRREDRSHLKCTHPSCGKTGHTEENCWVKNPEKIPRSLKEKFTNPTNRAVATNGTGLSPSTYAKPADTSPQMHRPMSCIKLRRSGGVDMGDSMSTTLDISKPVWGAFLAGDFCTTDTWLADTGANMHIVNDMKWFKKNTFCPSNIKISTADGSTTLDIEGTGVVNLVLKSPDGSPVNASLSEVAYAPRGKCNLFSAGMFTRKANVTGIYNDRYMTWITDTGHTIGHAIFGNGLYHLDAAKPPHDETPGHVVAATVDFDDPVWKWHRRLGHLGFQNMLNLLGSSTGMEITEKQIKAKLKASNYDNSGYRHDQIRTSPGEEITDQEHHLSEATQESQDESEDADDEDETDGRDLGPATMSKYFNQYKHAGMAKRKAPNDPIVAPRKSRRATHGLRDIELDHSDSDLSDSNADSWYYSEDGKISQGYWHQQRDRGEDKLKKKPSIESSDLHQFLEIRNATGAQEK
ncbi:hypothetical protein N7533_006422 [Penicillium manginii]|uniref:uncharacterized protein n=1 Tax=Penicillium manginii TaxID=203109 RepID=UPI002546DD80|nr:uncharacterized protein N7533_006422 [Penicillium manginii]KAJ5749394.1 hypothetical protein N7533_006422 [Penicillium manginii]